MTRTQAKLAITQRVTDLQGCKATELAAETALLLATQPYDVPELVDELCKEQELIEIEYVLPTLSWRAKEFSIAQGYQNTNDYRRRPDNLIEGATMILSPPFEISSRLLPSLRIADGVLSLEYVRTTTEGRAVYRWYADIPAGEYSETDLKSGCGGAGYQAMFGSLLASLGAASEAYAYNLRNRSNQAENADLFPSPVTEWAYQHDDEISLLREQIEDGKAVLIQEAS